MLQLPHHVPTMPHYREPATSSHYVDYTLSSTTQAPVSSQRTYEPIKVAASNVKKEILLYMSEHEPYSICYPSWWTVSEPAHGQVLFVSPRSNAVQFCENISVVVEQLAKDYDLPSYTGIILRQLSKDGECKILHSSASALSGERAHEVVYASVHNSKPIIFRQVWLIADRKAYIVTFTCDAFKYQACATLAQQVMASFRLLPRGNAPHHAPTLASFMTQR